MKPRLPPPPPPNPYIYNIYPHSPNIIIIHRRTGINPIPPTVKDWD